MAALGQASTRASRRRTSSQLPLVFDRERKEELEAHTAAGGTLFDYRRNLGKVTKLVRLLARRLALARRRRPSRRDVGAGDAHADAEAEADERRREEDGTVEYALRLLASRLQPAVLTDSFAVVEASKRLVAARDAPSALGDAARLEDYAARLGRQSVLREKWAVLYMLHSLAEENDAFRTRVPRMSLHRPFGRYAGLSLLDADRLRALQEGPDGAGGAGADGESRLGSELARRSRDAQLRRDELRRAVEENLSFEVPEAALLRDVIFALQGIDGRYVRFDEGRDAYVVAPEVGVPLPTRLLVRRITELGWMYRRVSAYVRETLALPAVGLVEQSFCGALQQELTDYYRLVAVLESQLADTLAAGARHPEYQFTLRRLHVWVQDPMQRLRLLAMLADAARGLRGGELVSAVEAHSRHGDPATLDVVRRVLGSVCQPLFRITRRWIRAGELEDPFCEFFVAADPAVGRDRLWRDKYALRPTMRPSFVDAATAGKILLIGKSINFLRECCGGDRGDDGGALVVADGAVTGAGAGAAGDEAAGDGLERLQAEVEVAAEQVNRRLMRAMVERYRIEDHCLALKKYLLLAQGDFIQHLMDLVHAELDRPAKQLYKHNLAGVVEHAIRGSNAQYEAPEVLDRISVRMLKPSEGDSGWEVFSLDYLTSSPIDVVFTASAISSYLRVFNFLWRLKRVEYELTAAWTLHPGRGAPSAVMARSLRMHHEMSHFVRNLHSFMMFEVLDVSWQELRERLRAAEHLDEVIDAHDSYLRSIESKALMGGAAAHVPLQPVVLRLFGTVTRFTRLHGRMHSRLAAHATERATRSRVAHERTERGRWGLTGGGGGGAGATADDAAAGVAAVVAEFAGELDEIGSQFRDLLRRFLGACEKHPSQDLRLLRVRIDFNGHYAQ